MLGFERVRARRLGARWLLLLSPLAGCDSPADAIGTCPTGQCDASTSDGGATSTGDGSSGTSGNTNTTGTTGGTASGTTGGTSGGTTGGTTGSDGGMPDVAPGMPCDVKAIVDSRCAATCHSDPPQGTYMSLVDRDDFHAPSTSDPGRAYYELAAERINASDNPMPPAVAEPLTESEHATLNAWLEAGAPAVREQCGTTGGTSGGTTGSGGETTGKGTEDLECYQFLAHAPGDKNAEFHVGVANDAYWNMDFEAPWEGTVYGMVIRPIIDNAEVLHHWLLYKTPTGGIDGNVYGSGGWHATGELMAGWAPGGIAIDFREHGDVGMELGKMIYTVEFHYNSADAKAMDASGVEICVKRDPPEHIAGMSWVGYDHGAWESYAIPALTGTQNSSETNCSNPLDEWQGTCAPWHTEPIHLLYMIPHMHEAGVHMKATIEGPDGSRVLHDEPFDFNYQTTYKTEEVLMPGESIVTTCSFSKPACVGQATNKEMCYLFTYHWPKGALTDNGPWGTLAHGENACLGQ